MPALAAGLHEQRICILSFYFAVYEEFCGM